MEQSIQERINELRIANNTLQAEVARLQRIEGELQDSEERYERIIHAISGYVYTGYMRQDGTAHIMHKRGVEKVTGYSAADYEKDAELWSQTIHPADREVVEEHLARICKGAPVSTVEYRIYHRNGTLRWMRNTAVVRQNHKGECVGFDGLITDITEIQSVAEGREALVDSLRILATQDELTGLLNRRGFNDKLERIWAQAKEYSFRVGLLLIDIDHFKVVNDSYGHQVGDDVIRECGQLLGNMVRSADVLARYAGDEFIVVIPRGEREQIEPIAKRILRSIREHVFVAREYDLKMTISIGGITRTPHTGDSLEDFLVSSDRALYRAKGDGRDTYFIEL